MVKKTHRTQFFWRQLLHQLLSPDLLHFLAQFSSRSNGYTKLFTQPSKRIRIFLNFRGSEILPKPNSEWKPLKIGWTPFKAISSSNHPFEKGQTCLLLVSGRITFKKGYDQQACRLFCLNFSIFLPFNSWVTNLWYWYCSFGENFAVKMRWIAWICLRWSQMVYWWFTMVESV